MKKKVLMLLVLLTVSYANAQIYKPNNTKIMSKFDIKEYEKMPKSPKTGLYVNEYGNEVQIMPPISGSYEGYVTLETLKNTRYDYYCVYDSNNNLVESATYFDSFRIKTTRFYDVFGYVIKEVDEEKDFPITLEKLREIVKLNLKVDIATNTSYEVSRNAKNAIAGNIPTYEICVFAGEEKPYSHYYLIDARTGNLLFKTENVVRDEARKKYIEHKKGLGK